ncbi:exo-alpha-sialidase [Rivibacter subsaxonicus]|uniref:Putative neuraminidase n=1 Tax=Rivibacter subsaxonicus TaxID=457575 RepID=A0A4Q7VG40_9BURK|nr:sialidase family protein [Rivibacter subsaxonicus]RZT94957.1 putative neuraminidase [Rivibacter subsaxonicus]
MALDLAAKTRPDAPPASSLLQRRRLLFAVLAAALAVELLREQIGGGGLPEPVPLRLVVPSPAAEPVGPLRLRALEPIDVPMPADTLAAHASSLVVQPGGEGLLAAWFAGSRESAPDVRIVASRFDPAATKWSAPQTLVDRDSLARLLGFGVRRIGNPVLWIDGRGRLHLFVVATGLGGWAASRVVHLRVLEPGASSIDAGTPVEARVLPLSPLWGISMMVRGAPAPTVGGGALLPLHFEIGIDVPMLLEISEDGAPLQVSRITNRTNSRQPSIVALGPQQMLAFLRDDGEPRGYVQRARSMDAGRHWEDLPAMELNNPDSALAALRLPDGSLVLAINPDEHDRRRLVLMRSTDGVQWREEAVLDDAPNTSDLGAPKYRGLTEYSYPTLALSGNELHVSYTLHRRLIRHRRFVLEPAGP